MKNTKIFLALTATLLLASLYSCQKSKVGDLQEAQLCLNTATPATARSCVSKIADNVTPLAYSLRCSAIFLEQGFSSPASFINALNSINSSGNCTGGCSSTVNALNAFNFTSAGVSTPTQRAANNAAAAEAFSACSQSDATIYTQISSLFKIGTLAAMAAYTTSSGAAFTQDNLETAISTLTPSDIGAIANVTYSNACSNIENAPDSTKIFCNELKTAVTSPGSTSEAAIGACLLNKLTNPAYVCP